MSRTRPIVHPLGAGLMTRYYDFHGLCRLVVRSASVRVIDHFESEFGAFDTRPLSDLDLDVTIGPFSVDVPESATTFGRYSIADDWVFGHERYKVATWRFALSALADRTTWLFFHGGVFSLDFLQHHFVEPIIRYKVAQHRVALLGGGSVARDGRAVLFSGLGHTGKTALAIRQVQQGWEFQSDDLTFVSAAGQTFSYPRRLHVTDHLFGVCPGPMRRLAVPHKLSIKAKKLVYEATLRYGELQESVRMDDLVPHARVAERAKLGAVLVLTTSVGTQLVEPRSLTRSQLLDRVMAINGLEGRAFTDLLWACHARGNAMSPGEWWQRERSILDSAVANVPGVELAVPRRATDRRAVLEHAGRVLEQLDLAVSGEQPQSARQAQAAAAVAQPSGAALA